VVGEIKVQRESKVQPTDDDTLIIQSIVQLPIGSRVFTDFNTIRSFAMAALSKGYANKSLRLMCNIKAKSRYRVFTSTQFIFGIGENNVKVTVHAAAIAKQSQALDVLINGPIEEAQTRTARLEDVLKDTFVQSCQFAYTGDYEMPVFI
jgi:hypothetical protein